VPIDVEALGGKIQTHAAAISLCARLRKSRAVGVEFWLIFSVHIVHADGAMLGAWVTSGIATTKPRCGYGLKTTTIFLIIGAGALEFTVIGSVSAVTAACSWATVIAGFRPRLADAAHGGVEPEATVVRAKVAELVGLAIVGGPTCSDTGHFCTGRFGNQTRVRAFAGVAAVCGIEGFSRLTNLILWKAFSIDARPTV
jgi:hypothetical protein